MRAAAPSQPGIIKLRGETFKISEKVLYKPNANSVVYFGKLNDRNIKIESDKQFDIYDGVHLEFKLITKDKIVQLKYYEPEFYNEHNFNQSRDIIVKIEKEIT